MSSGWGWSVKSKNGAAVRKNGSGAGHKNGGSARNGASGKNGAKNGPRNGHRNDLKNGLMATNGATVKNGALVKGGVVLLADKTKNYRPTDKEPFMNERQREYFRVKLLEWREDILKEAKETLQHLQDENQNHPDLADRASSETDRAIELRARDRQRKLIAKIDAALRPSRRRQLRLLRGDRRADLAQAARGASDRDAVGRGAGAPRAPRARLSRRLIIGHAPHELSWPGRAAVRPFRFSAPGTRFPSAGFPYTVMTGWMLEPGAGD